jgi:hypothetical protein
MGVPVGVSIPVGAPVWLFDGRFVGGDVGATVLVGLFPFDRVGRSPHVGLPLASSAIWGLSLLNNKRDY